MVSDAFKNEYTTTPNTLKTTKRPEKEPLFKRRSMNPAVDVRKAMIIQASDE